VPKGVASPSTAKGAAARSAYGGSGAGACAVAEPSSCARDSRLLVFRAFPRESHACSLCSFVVVVCLLDCLLLFVLSCVLGFFFVLFVLFCFVRALAQASFRLAQLAHRLRSCHRGARRAPRQALPPLRFPYQVSARCAS
jgi:hypothetical protein